MLLTPFNFTLEFEMQDAARIFCPSWFRVYNCLTLLISKCVANTGFLLLQFFSRCVRCVLKVRWGQLLSFHEKSYFSVRFTLAQIIQAFKFEKIWEFLGRVDNSKLWEHLHNFNQAHMWEQHTESSRITT